LIGYLEKHQQEIINYNCPSLTGKNSGSEGIEKETDLTVAQRQKNREMVGVPLVVKP
jgi:hypothetical protein